MGRDRSVLRRLVTAVGVMAAAWAVSAPAAVAPPAAAQSALSSAVCGPRIVVQTNWFPQPEHGALYQLVVNEGALDKEKGHYNGTITGTDVTLQIRIGGPYLGGQQVPAQMYQDTEIDLGQVASDQAVRDFGRLPTIGVVTPLEINPQILMWSADRWSFQSFEDIGRSGAKIVTFPGVPWIDFLIARGYATREQIDESYDGSPTRFISEGDLIQQGFASSEPYKYENEFPQWGGKKIGFFLLNDAGFPIYPLPLAARPETIEAKRECLRAFVPMVQQAQVDYIRSPERVNSNLIQIARDLASTWTLTEGGVAYAASAMRDYKLVDNGPDSTIGNFDMDRMQQVIDILVPIFETRRTPQLRTDVKPTDIVTNEFIDPRIGL
jgi:hypothetical protein